MSFNSSNFISWFWNDTHSEWGGGGTVWARKNGRNVFVNHHPELPCKPFNGWHDYTHATVAEHTTIIRRMGAYQNVFHVDDILNRAMLTTAMTPAPLLNNKNCVQCNWCTFRQHRACMLSSHIHHGNEKKIGRRVPRRANGEVVLYAIIN